MPSNADHKIQFCISGEIFDKYLDKYPLEQRNEIAKNIFTDYINGNYTPENITIKNAKEEITQAELTIKSAKAKQADDFESERLRKIRNENDLLERQLTYRDTFEDEPSEHAKRAMKKGIKQRSITSQEYEKVTKFIILRRDFLNSNLWVAKCNLCKDGETYDTRKQAIDDMVRHLTTEHAKKVMSVE